MPSRTRSTMSYLVFALLGFALASPPAFAAGSEPDLAAFDLDDLMAMEVTSVSKKTERAFEAPAAVFVLTSDDIRRSNQRTIPELLRMIPGVQVAQLSSSSYAITVRGFNSIFSEKLLVLIDGRTVYQPLFGGVLWDAQDLPLADIDRIEVIRGPGGTVWGANAVNGVINIVTKSAADTQGLHLEVGAGNYEPYERPGAGVARYGGSVGDKIQYRAYLKAFDRDALKHDGATPADDAWQQLRFGFRTDSQPSENGTFTLQGDYYDGVTRFIAESDVSGGNILARYTHEFTEEHNASLQFYYDRTDRNFGLLNYELDTWDLEYEHQFAPSEWLDMVWGFNYRRTRDNADLNTAVIGIAPDKRKLSLISGFLQAEARALDDLLRATLGTKLSDTDTTGFEFQPSARIAIVPNDKMTFWTSISRAVRTPSRANEDFTSFSFSTTGVPIENTGNRGVEAEDLLSFEAGARLQPTPWMHFDVAGFYNIYEDLIVSDVHAGSEMPPPTGTSGITRIPAGAVFYIRSTASTHADATAYGFELFNRMQLVENKSFVKKWWVDLTYAFLKVDMDRDGGIGLDNHPANADGAAGQDKSDARGRTESKHTVGMRNHFNLLYNLEFDIAYFFVGKVDEVGLTEEGVGSYHRLDLRSAWRMNDNVELSVSVENVNDGGHKEWNSEIFGVASVVPRTVYGKLTLDF